ncbi:MAG: P-type conjugative transfer protein TrbJ [Synergistaceae bacterium]|nr:P-type conjugative transfer protein TrbJ [Synergistaceae bacterium]
MKKFKFLVVPAVLACFISGLLVKDVNAGGGITGGATEFTQIANNLELMAQVSQMEKSLHHEIQMLLDNITMITNQITMITDMAQNTLALPQRLIGSVTGAIQNVMNAYNRAQGILARLSNIDEQFYESFYSALESGQAGAASGWVRNYAEEYFKLSETLEREAKKTIESLKVSAGDITDSSKLLEELSSNASSAAGRNAILQAGNEILGFMGGELVKVRTLLVEQTKTYLDYAERQRSKEDAAADIWRQDLEKWSSPSHSPVEWEW